MQIDNEKIEEGKVGLEMVSNELRTKFAAEFTLEKLISANLLFGFYEDLEELMYDF